MDMDHQLIAGVNDVLRHAAATLSPGGARAIRMIAGLVGERCAKTLVFLFGPFWRNRKPITFSAICCVAIALWIKWKQSVDSMCKWGVTQVGKTTIKLLQTHYCGGCLYCRKALNLQEDEGLTLLRTPMMRCRRCMWRPVFADVWVRTDAYDRASAVVLRHRTHDDNTATTEVAATHGVKIRSIAADLLTTTHHLEVCLLIAAIDQTTSLVDIRRAGVKIDALTDGTAGGAGQPGTDGGGGSTEQQPEAIIESVEQPCEAELEAAVDRTNISPPDEEDKEEPYSVVPRGTVGMGYLCVDDIKGPADFFRINRITDEGIRAAALSKQQEVCEIYDALLKESGMEAASAFLRLLKGHPQYLVIDSKMRKKDLAYVAGKGPIVQLAAMLNRHFAVKPTPYGGQIGVVQDAIGGRVATVVEKLITMLKEAGRAAKEYNEYPSGYDVDARDTQDFVHKKSTFLRDYEWVAFLPKSWSKKRGQSALSKLAISNESLRQRHTFFVKLNEALQKMKPRAIQSTGDQGCMTQAFGPGFLEAIVFGISFLEARSVKHAGPRHLRERLATLIDTYQNGYAGSMDYGAFDSSTAQHRDAPRNALKELIEIRILKAILGEDVEFSDVSRDAMEDRCRNFLKSNSEFWRIYTTTFGRESGDRGTSCLNFLVNVTLFLLFMGLESGYRKLCKTFPGGIMEYTPDDTPEMNLFVQGLSFDEEIIEKWLKGEPTGFDLLGEGDDGLWLLTERFIDDSPHKDDSKDGDKIKRIRVEKRKMIMDRIIYWSSMAGTQLEPQDENGEAKGENRLQPVWRRMEHCSKVIVPYKVAGKLRVGLLPKLRKTIGGGGLAFGLVSGDELNEQTERNIAFTKYLACAYNCTDSPLMFNYFYAKASVMMFGRVPAESKDITWAAAKVHSHNRPDFVFNNKDYTHRAMADTYGKHKAEIKDRENDGDIKAMPLNLIELMRALRTAHVKAISIDGHTEAMEKATEREAPKMTVEWQRGIVESFKGATTEETIAELEERVKDALGNV